MKTFIIGKIIQIVKENPVEALAVTFISFFGLPLILIISVVTILPKGLFLGSGENGEVNKNFAIVSERFQIDENQLLVYHDLKTKFDYDLDCSVDEVKEYAIEFIKDIDVHIEYVIERTTYTYETWIVNGKKKRVKVEHTEEIDKDKDVVLEKDVLNSFNMNEAIKDYIDTYVDSHMDDYIGTDYKSISSIDININYQTVNDIKEDLYTLYQDEFTQEEYEQWIELKSIFISANASGKQAIFPTEGVVTSPYGYRQDPFDGGRAFHNGIDIANSLGTEIKSIEDGEVIYAKYDSTNGNMVKIEHKDNLVSLYLHTSKMLVNVGDEVRKGDVVALMGSTGRSTGSHIHFMILKDGHVADPTFYVEFEVISKDLE